MLTWHLRRLPCWLQCQPLAQQQQWPATAAMALRQHQWQRQLAMRHRPACWLPMLRQHQQLLLVLAVRLVPRLRMLPRWLPCWALVLPSHQGPLLLLSAARLAPALLAR